MQQWDLKFLNIYLKFAQIFLYSKKYLTQKNVVEKVSTNVSQGKVFFLIFISILHRIHIAFIEVPHTFDSLKV